jgi:hypothetical protein
MDMFGSVVVVSGLLHGLYGLCFSVFFCDSDSYWFYDLLGREYIS